MKWLKAAEHETLINADDLDISFNDDFKDYVIYKPGDTTQYLVRSLDTSLGFAPRYILSKALAALKESYPVHIPAHVLEFQQLPEIDNKVIRKLGWLISRKRKPIDDISKKIKDMQQQYYNAAPTPRGWEDIAGPSTENVYKELNRPEEQFDISHL